MADRRPRGAEGHEVVGIGLRRRPELGPVGGEDGEVGLLAGLDRPHLIFKAQGAGPLAGGEAQGVEAGEGVRPMLDLLEERRQPDLREVVELVAARGAVAADAHRHPGAVEGQEVGHAGAELQVRAGAVDHAETSATYPVEMLGGHPDAVGQPEVGRQQSLVGEVLDLVPPTFELAHGERLVPLLQGVGVHGPPPAQRQLAHPLPERIGAGEDEAGVEHVAQPPLRPPLEFVAQSHGVGEGPVGLRTHGRRQAVAAVHEALPGEGAQPGALDGLEQPPRAGPEADVLDRGGAAEQALRRAEHRAPVGALVVVGRLQRPDPLPQPGEQPPLLRQTPEEGLPQVEMPLDQPRQHQASRDVEHPCALGRIDMADGINPAVPDQEVGAAQDGRLGVQGEEGAAAEEEGFQTCHNQPSSRSRRSSSWVKNPSKVPNCWTSRCERWWRLNSRTAVTTASRLLRAPVCLMAS
jgi:hypothetical protein